MSIERLLAGYRDGSSDPAQVVGRAYERARSSSDPAWISLVPWSAVKAALERLRSCSTELPLYGVPFAIKDNIDLGGVPTTAACPAYAYTPAASAFAVARLVAAGAVPIGKTNMDQFATGLTGTRTPYGACASVVDARYVSGGSSSGSAVAVADGTVPFALATDTAGSGRVPAAMNAIVGFKASLGAVGTRGVVPACRSLDCVSLLTTSVADAARVLAVVAGHDPADPYSRADRGVLARALGDAGRGAEGALADAGRGGEGAPAGAGSGAAQALARRARIAVPRPEQMVFGGDGVAAAAWCAALARAAVLGWELVEIDYEPFAEAARMLYDGPWIAERFASVGRFAADHRRDVDPIVRRVILRGRDHSAVDAFRARHRLAELRLVTGAVWEVADALLLPTVPTLFTAAEIADDPIARNALLGTYTNFVNLLDLCAVAVPGGPREDGLPFGISLIAPGGADRSLLSLAAHWHGEAAEEALRGEPDGAAGTAQRGAPAAAAEAAIGRRSAAMVSHGPAPPATVRLAVVGAHLSGEPLNDQLVGLGATLLETVNTAPGYRLFALPDTSPAKPGLVGGGPLDGPGIELELWELAAEGFGMLVAGVPPPLCIGTISLDDGRAVKGFLCEANAVAGALDITAYGGWRVYRASLGLPGPAPVV